MMNRCIALLSVSTCDATTGRSHVLMAADPQIPCWSLMHSGYLAAFILAVLTYYPAGGMLRTSTVPTLNR